MMSEVEWYWKAIVDTLRERQLLRRRADNSLIVPEADAILLPDRCIFLLDMHRLAGIPRETWLDRALWDQWRAALQGRRVIVSDGFGLAIQIARNPGLSTKRLPAVIPLSPDLIPDAPYHICLGYTKRGRIDLDLADTHRAILIGGTTGSGKTNLIRSIVIQMVSKHSPDEVRIAIVDPKEVDFGPAFDALPHLFAPVAHSIEEGIKLIEQVEAERIRRQAIMAAAGVADWRDLENPVPLLLLAVDEAADFAGSMDTLKNIARKGRAFGISVIVGTQHPEAKVIDAQVRANLPTAIAFQTRTPVESRVILGRGGAEELNRPGLALAFIRNKQGVGRWEKVQTLWVPPDLQPKIPQPVLSEIEADLVLYALEQLGGAFIINRLDEAFRQRISRRKIVAIAQQWEKRGWLTSPRHATDPRRITPELEALARLVKASTGSQATQDVTG